MKKKYGNKEFNEIVKDILELDEFQKMKNIRHHGISRYNHLLRVAYWTYFITKKRGLNYVEATRGALLHDFFSDETKDENQINALRNHPLYAYKNASKYFNLTKIESDIIKTHMYPVTFIRPHYQESIIVDIIDDVSSIYERFYSTRKQISAALTFIYVLINLKFM